MTTPAFGVLAPRMFPKPDALRQPIGFYQEKEQEGRSSLPSGIMSPCHCEPVMLFAGCPGKSTKHVIPHQ